MAYWDNEIVGSLDIVGEVSEQRGMSRLPGMQPGQQVMRRDPNRVLRGVLPFPEELEFTAAGIKTITIQPQRSSRVQRLVLYVRKSAAASNDDLNLIYVTKLDVGQDPQFGSAGIIPAGVFLPFAFGVALAGDTAEPGIVVTLGIQCIAAPSAGSVFVGGCIIGSVLRD